MFWGMNLKPNRKYSQTTAKSFHISQAALDPEGTDDTVNKIYISGEDNQKYLICTLRKNVCEQVQLDLNFAEGDPICFQTVGSGNVSLSGYLVESSFFGNDGGEEEEESEDENMVEQVKALLNGGEPGKKKKDKKAQKAGKAEEEDDDEDSDDDDEALNAALESDDEDEEDDEEGNEVDSDEDDEEDDDEDDDDEDDDEDEEDDDEEVQEPKKKVAKLDNKQQQQQKQQNGEQQKSKKEKKAEKQQQQKQQQQQQQQPQQKQQQQQKTGEERTLTGGVKIVDLRVGNGEEAKQGKRAHVYYEGRLKSNNKVFDSLKNGAPFKFKIGQGEVIKSWDIGVSGMKVGGKRRIICPPHMAYGSRGSPPTIPPNSTLVFEVELKSVSK